MKDINFKWLLPVFFQSYLLAPFLKLEGLYFSKSCVKWNFLHNLEGVTCIIPYAKVRAELIFYELMNSREQIFKQKKFVFTKYSSSYDVTSYMNDAVLIKYYTFRKITIQDLKKRPHKEGKALSRWNLKCKLLLTCEQVIMLLTC